MGLVETLLKEACSTIAQSLRFLDQAALATNLLHRYAALRMRCAEVGEEVTRRAVFRVVRVTAAVHPSTCLLIHELVHLSHEALQLLSCFHCLIRCEEGSGRAMDALAEHRTSRQDLAIEVGFAPTERLAFRSLNIVKVRFDLSLDVVKLLGCRAGTVEVAFDDIAHRLERVRIEEVTLVKRPRFGRSRLLGEGEPYGHSGVVARSSQSVAVCGRETA